MATEGLYSQGPRSSNASNLQLPSPSAHTNTWWSKAVTLNKRRHMLGEPSVQTLPTGWLTAAPQGMSRNCSSRRCCVMPSFSLSVCSKLAAGCITLSSPWGARKIHNQPPPVPASSTPVDLGGAQCVGKQSRRRQQQGGCRLAHIHRPAQLSLQAPHQMPPGCLRESPCLPLEPGHTRGPSSLVGLGRQRAGPAPPAFLPTHTTTTHRA